MVHKSVAMISFCILCLSITVGYADIKERRLALVIGNGDYRSCPLKNPVNDARSIANALEGFGFTVFLKENLTRVEMLNVITAFGEKLRLGPGVGLFYYAGHGVQYEGKNYLIPVDANITHVEMLELKAVNAEHVILDMDTGPDRINIIILDACRNLPVARSYRSAETHALLPVLAPTGTLIAYSTSPGKKASDGNGRNGLYTTELIKYMNVPGMRLVDIFNNVRRSVRIKTYGKQVPWETTSLEKPFFFDQVNIDAASYIPVENNLPDVKSDVPVNLEVNSMVKTGQPGNPSVSSTYLESATGIEFVWVPEGCFQMGCSELSSDCDSDEKPIHKVCLSGYWIAKTEITNNQFVKFLNDCDTGGVNKEGASWFQTKEVLSASHINKYAEGYYVEEGYGQYPVIGVSWYGCKEFARWLSEKSGLSFDLPTEAQWQYAACSGGKNETYSGSNDIDAIGWYSGNTDRIQPVGLKLPNGLGIYDMTGNVWEWCRDIYLKDAYRKHSVKNPLIYRADVYREHSSKRVIRGGSFSYGAEICRISNRGNNWLIDNSSDDLGFRLVREPNGDVTVKIDDAISANY